MLQCGMKLLKSLGPSGTVYAYKHDGKEVAMEYGTPEDDEMPHGYVVPSEKRHGLAMKPRLLWRHGNTYTKAILILNLVTSLIQQTHKICRRCRTRY